MNDPTTCEPAANEPGVLETRFPHIITELHRTWPDSQLYLDSLMIDTRGGRQGFPMDAMSEILFLEDLLWWHTHESVDAMFSEDFIFVDAESAEARKSEIRPPEVPPLPPLNF